MNNFINVAIAGATGYIGIELIKILSKHPNVKIKYIYAQKSIGKSIGSFSPILKKKSLPKISKLNSANFQDLDILFTALPNGEAQKISKKLTHKLRLIDLSGDFRLINPNIYKKWYKISHKAKSLIKKSIYSLPELVNTNLMKFKIISCPGCYPTSIQIPLVPLLKRKLIDAENIIIDSKSGYSGAGKNLKKRFKHADVFNSTSAYAISFHKHVPEIEQQLKKISNKKINIQFTPHILPMFRGILTTIYVKSSKKINSKKIYLYLKKYYKRNYFIKVLKFNKPIGTSNVMNTNFCNISVCKSRDDRKVIILSAIDNLIKGGSGQAVQNMNKLYGFSERNGFK